MENPFETIARRLSSIEELLLDIKHRPASASILPIDELLTVKQAADLLDLTTATIYGLVYEKRIPFNKPGGRLYFNRDQLLEWVKNGRKATTQELEEQARQQIANRLDRRSKSKAQRGGQKV